MKHLLLLVVLTGCATAPRAGRPYALDREPQGQLVAHAGNWVPSPRHVSLLNGLPSGAVPLPPGLLLGGLAPVPVTTSGSNSFAGTTTSANYVCTAASGAACLEVPTGARIYMNYPTDTLYYTVTGGELYFRGSRIVVLDGGGYFNGLVDLLAGLDVQGNIVNAGSTGALSINLNDADGTCVGNGVGTDCDGALSAGYLVAGSSVSAVAASASAKAGVISGAPGIWLANAIPTLSNFALLSDGTGTIVNSPSGGFVDLRVNNATQVKVSTTNGILQTARALPTCAVAIEWAELPDVASGVATAKRSKMCLCTSNGSNTYAWQNMVTGTMGTTTTCGTE